MRSKKKKNPLRMTGFVEEKIDPQANTQLCNDICIHIVIIVQMNLNGFSTVESNFSQKMEGQL